uniref:Uncharacterized protein n=1 Tax=Anopheles coluzzii TaxID=1518534 RepID=A0A8W7PN72_ANOCL
MGNPSLTYEILLYLNSFYFGMFATCELGMLTLKAVNLKYPDHILLREACILVALCLVETIRIILGRRGSLSDHDYYCTAATGAVTHIFGSGIIPNDLPFLAVSTILPRCASEL